MATWMVCGPEYDMMFGCFSVSLISAFYESPPSVVVLEGSYLTLVHSRLLDAVGAVSRRRVPLPVTVAGSLLRVRPALVPPADALRAVCIGVFGGVAQLVPQRPVLLLHQPDPELQGLLLADSAHRRGWLSFQRRQEEGLLCEGRGASLIHDA